MTQADSNFISVAFHKDLNRSSKFFMMLLKAFVIPFEWSSVNCIMISLRTYKAM
jgi:hypothetical protein